MPTSNEDLTGFVWDTGKFMWSWSALHMLSKAPFEGYNVPWTGTIRKAAVKGWGATGGGKTPWALRGAKNVRFARPIKGKVAQAVARKTGFWGASGMAFSKGGQALTRGAATKLIIGRAAGFALGAYNLYLGAQLLSLPIMGYHAIAQKVKAAKGLELGGYFPESKMSLTSRQRSVQAITASRLQARSAVGNEAFLYHR